MIRVIIERRLKKGEQISRLLGQLRLTAMTQPGYISGETLVNTEDTSVIAVISTWRSIEDWKSWVVSKQRVAVEQLVRPLLVGPAIVNTYRTMSIEELEYLEDPVGWLQQKEHPSLDG